jgi:UDP-glucoronosyl and UDP-glucosyl transferase
VARHNGAPHLHSAGQDLGFVAYHNLDILLIVTAFVMFLIILIKKCCCSTSKKVPIKEAKKGKKNN